MLLDKLLLGMVENEGGLVLAGEIIAPLREKNLSTGILAPSRNGAGLELSEKYARGLELLVSEE